MHERQAHHNKAHDTPSYAHKTHDPASPALERKIAQVSVRLARPDAPYQDPEVAAGWARHHRLFKFNPNHDELGRFDYGSGGRDADGRSVTTPNRSTVIITDPDGHTEVRSGGSQSWRNNNPGNIRSGPFATRQGAIGEANGFAVFASEQDGQSALNALLSNSKYSNMTINSAIATYSPSSENDPVSHAENISRISGLPGDRLISSLSQDEFFRLTSAIKIAEGFKPGSVSKHD